MMEETLFSNNVKRPLADRLRPQSLKEVVGQEHIVGDDAPLGRMIKSGKITSFILWGPPGCGKTTIARLIAENTNLYFEQISAVFSGVADLKRVFQYAQERRATQGKGTLLFVDEIHRFNKSQQDGFLPYVEDGTIILVGATTENPSFEVITPLLSRCQVYVLKPLDVDDLSTLLKNVIDKDEYFKKKEIIIQETDALFRFAGGDARKLLNILELVIGTESDERVTITDKLVIDKLQENPSAYDKGGEMHYDIISAFIKSIRGSDPDAAIYWLARMVAGGEDPEFIARRLVISAAEDIGLANPNALLLANACFDALKKIGWPEGRIILAETTVYLACSAKSNSAYLAIDEALALVNRTGNLPVPLHLRNAPTKLMSELNYGKEYKYAHDYEGHFVKQAYLPHEVENERLWIGQSNASESKLIQYMKRLWGDRL